jgi:hypothetical protein
VGACDSVWQAIDVYLHRHHPEKLPQFYKNWGVNMDWVNPRSQYQPGDKPENFLAKDNLLLKHLVIHRPDLFL